MTAGLEASRRYLTGKTKRQPCLGFTRTHIPEDKQVPPWSPLGGYPDILEM